jgi:hypothetical protein
VVESRRLPNLDLFSVLVATILLAYASLPYIEIPGREIGFPLAGVRFAIRLNASTAIVLILGGITASGSHWLLKNHPRSKPRQLTAHLILPSLTAVVLAIPLSSLAISPLWWLMFGIAAIFISLVLIAEYITVDPQDIRHPAAGAVLTAISFALYLILAISLRSLETRLFLILPALFLAAGLVSLRTFNLRFPGKWLFPQALTVAVILSQLTFALHYLPVDPLAFGLLSVGIAYALTALISNLSQGRSLSQAATEPIFVLIVLVIITIWIR